VKFAAGAELFIASSEYAGFVSGPWQMKGKFLELKRRVGSVFI